MPRFLFGKFVLTPFSFCPPGASAGPHGWCDDVIPRLYDSRRSHEISEASFHRIDARRRRGRIRRRIQRVLRRDACGALFVRRRLPPDRGGAELGLAERKFRSGAERRRGADAVQRGIALPRLRGAAARQVAAAPRRRRPRGMGGASPAHPRIVKKLLLIAPLLLPIGCDRAAAHRPGAQVAAKVNGAEISIQQLRANAAPGSVAQALEKVIDREVLVQKALAARLDRDPQVAQALDDARRQLLAQAYLERAAGSAASGSSKDEVRAFYAENPALFSQRRIYRLRELAVAAPAEMIDVLRASAAQARDLDEVAAWLKARNASFSIAALAQPAEQLPLAFLPQLARMKAGEMAVFATPLGASVVQLVHAVDAPLAEQEATAQIEQFLAGRRRLETAAAEVKRLREVATIEYLGEFKRGH